MQNSDEDLAKYAEENNIRGILESLTRALIIDRPEDPIKFLIDALKAGHIPVDVERQRPRPFVIHDM